MSNRPSNRPNNFAAIRLDEKFALFDEQWTPKVIAEMNDYQFKIVKIEGDFVWHSHADTDEAFFVIDGDLRIDLRDAKGSTTVTSIELGPGDLYVVPAGVEHKPCADNEVRLMLIEPRGVVNTGDESGSMDADSERQTAQNDVWI